MAQSHDNGGGHYDEPLTLDQNQGNKETTDTRTRRDVLRLGVKLVGAAAAGVAAASLSSAGEEVAAATCWYGRRKGIEFKGGGFHHYVEFDVYACMRCSNWRVSGPSSPQLWVNPPNCNNRVRAYYSFPGVLPDFRSANSWKLCVC